MYHIQVFNLSRGKVFALPNEYCDWTEACTEGQQYIFNRKEENNEALFFRVVDNCDFISEKEEKEETKSCNGVCFACPDTAKCEAYQSLNQEDCSTYSKPENNGNIGRCNKTDPYKNCLLTQEILNEINRHFNSAYSVQLNRN